MFALWSERTNDGFVLHPAPLLEPSGSLCALHCAHGCPALSPDTADSSISTMRAVMASQRCHCIRQFTNPRPQSIAKIAFSLIICIASASIFGVPRPAEEDVTTMFEHLVPPHTEFGTNYRHAVGARRGQRTAIQSHPIIKRQHAGIGGVKVARAFIAVPIELSCPGNFVGDSKCFREALDHFKVVAIALTVWDLKVATHKR